MPSAFKAREKPSPPAIAIAFVALGAARPPQPMTWLPALAGLIVTMNSMMLMYVERLVFIEQFGGGLEGSVSQIRTFRPLGIAANLVLHSGGCFGLTAKPHMTACRALSTLQSGQAFRQFRQLCILTCTVSMCLAFHPLAHLVGGIYDIGTVSSVLRSARISEA